MASSVCRVLVVGDPCDVRAMAMQGAAERAQSTAAGSSRCEYGVRGPGQGCSMGGSGQYGWISSRRH
jgi:hypothetical protein